MSMNGIDISSWQKGINLNVVPYDFVIVKATGGTGYVNPDYNRAVQQAISAGKKVGVYHYAREKGCKGSAVAEADFFIKTVQEYIGKAILVLDWEEELSLGVAWAKEFLDRVYQKTGIKAFLYTSASVTRQYNWTPVAQAGYPLWMAQYPNAKLQNGYRDKPWTDGKGYGAFKTIAIHQYSGTGRLPGYNGNLDMNKAYMDATAWDKYAGKAGEQKPDQKPAKPVANPIIKAGQAHARNFIAENLEADGIVGPETRKARVMVLQHALNLDYGLNITVDGIWGTKSENGFKNHGTRIAKTHYMVTALQILLNTHGYAAAVENPGEYTEELEEIVGKFQKDCGMFPDKIAGYKTFKALIS